jgi:large conductance mechanosensitive channel
MLKEFKEFAIKGNMIDMAVGIVIGASFGTIVSSLVNDIIMPVVSGILRLPDFSNLFVKVSGEGTFSSVAQARDAGASVLAYGSFINAFLAFAVVAFALFMVVKGINKLKKEQPIEEVSVETGPTEIELLKEIRDALKK